MGKPDDNADRFARGLRPAFSALPVHGNWRPFPFGFPSDCRKFRLKLPPLKTTKKAFDDGFKSLARVQGLHCLKIWVS